MLYFPRMRIGSWLVTTYTLRSSFAVLAGLCWVWLMAPRHGYRRNQLIGALWATAGGAFLGGRIGYALLNLDYFVSHPWEIFLWRAVGGLTGSAAWVGALVGVWLWSRGPGANCFQLLRLLAPAALLITAGTWWGCAAAGCAWGLEASTAPAWLSWAVVEAPDLYQTSAPRYAVQLLGAGWALFGVGLTLLWNHYSAFWLALYMAGAALLTYLQANPMPSVGRYRLDFLTALLLMLFFLYQQSALLLSDHRNPADS